MGIEILTQHRVEKVDKHCIYFSNGNQLTSDITVWAAGVKAPKVLESFTDFERDNINRLMVYATLQTYSDPNVFAFGDCSHCQLDARNPHSDHVLKLPVNKQAFSRCNGCSAEWPLTANVYI